MKSISALISVFFALFILSSCGAEPEGEQNKTEKTEKISKKTREGMESILKSCDIKLHDDFKYVENKKKSDSYIIKYEAKDVDESKKTELDNWYAEQVKMLENKGWKKTVMRENEELIGTIYNDIVLNKPKGSKVKVAYGISLTSGYNAEEKSYTFTASIN